MRRFSVCRRFLQLYGADLGLGTVTYGRGTIRESGRHAWRQLAKRLFNHELAPLLLTSPMSHVPQHSFSVPVPPEVIGSEQFAQMQRRFDSGDSNLNA